MPARLLELGVGITFVRPAAYRGHVDPRDIAAAIRGHHLVSVMHANNEPAPFSRLIR